MYADLFDTPWNENPRRVWFCSDECEDVYCNSEEFAYLSCEACERRVCSQNPSNGWQVQFRQHEELGRVCLRCYQDEILLNGQPRNDYESQSIKGGMFFSFGNPEPLAAGFVADQDFEYYFVHDAGSVARYNSRALEFLDRGSKILTAFESLAIGGLEGYVTMMEKETPSV